MLLEPEPERVTFTQLRPVAGRAAPLLVTRLLLRAVGRFVVVVSRPRQRQVDGVFVAPDEPYTPN